METVEKTERRIGEVMKELQDMGMHIDLDASLSFFYLLFQDTMPLGLNLSSKLKNQTLLSLLNVGYASVKDSSSESDGSSHGSSNYEESGVYEEWSQIFTKDGHFRVDQILPQLPQAPQMSNNRLSSFLQNLKSAKLALAHYNKENQDAPYELVMPVTSESFHTFGHNYYIHVNFFAKSKKLDSNSCSELFFAEVWTGANNEDPVQSCCILKPNLSGSSSDSVKRSPLAWVFHPEDVVCSCNIPSNCYYESDDE